MNADVKAQVESMRSQVMAEVTAVQYPDTKRPHTRVKMANLLDKSTRFDCLA